MPYQILLVENTEERLRLFPLVATRPIGNLRVGILTINVKWRKLMGVSVFYDTENYLHTKFSAALDLGEETLVIRSHVLPTADLVRQFEELDVGQVLVHADGGDWLGFRLQKGKNYRACDWTKLEYVYLQGDCQKIVHPEDIYNHNASQILFDISFCLSDEMGRAHHGQNKDLGSEVYICEGANVEDAVLDARLGPIFIGKDAVVESGAVLKGPVAICTGARVKSGAVLYSNVTVGDNSTVCGEINNTVIWGNSAKGHEGYLGCAVLGEGVNIGAGTCNSNLKNDWSSVKLYDYSIEGYRDTKMQKCGVIIGDFSMLAIQSRINTGTIIGVGVQIALSNFIPKFVPDFIWLTDDKSESYIFERFCEMLIRRAQLRKESFLEGDENILRYIYENTL